jgi:predicted membrane protein
MRRQLTSSSRAKGFAIAIFLIGLGIISITDNWWPEMMLVIGASLAIRQLFLRKYYEMMISIIVFLGIFVTNKYTFSWKVVWPVIFFTSALFILMREYVDAKLASEDQKEEDLNHELEESQEDSQKS